MKLKKGKEMVNENQGQSRICIIALTTMSIRASRPFSPHQIGAKWGKRGETQEEVSVGFTVC